MNVARDWSSRDSQAHGISEPAIMTVGVGLVQ